MKRPAYLVFFFFFLPLAFLAQIEPDTLTPTAQNKLVETGTLGKTPDEKLIQVNNLLATGKITDREAIASLYNKRAEALNDKYRNLIAKYVYMQDTTGTYVINMILKDYQTAMDTCALYKPVHQLDRMTFLGVVNNYHPLYEADQKELPKYGFKDEFEGVGFGANYMYGKTSWLGVEISAAQIVQPSYSLKNTDPATGRKKTVYRMGMPYAVSAVTLGLNKDMSSQAFSITVSAMHVKAPVLFDPTQLCFTQNSPSQRMVASYRPEIGVGNSFLHIGYAYNLVFKSSLRNKYETHMLVVRLSYPLIKFRD